MVRPRTPIGTYGTIAVRRQPSGRYVARTRYRDWDGKSRHVQTTATTRPAAERELKKKLAERSLFHPGFTGMSADSVFPALVDYWLEDMELEDRLSRTTRQLYERNMRTLVLPFFQDVTLREIGVARCDYFLKQLAKQSFNRARQARVVLRLSLGLAVRHEILPRNPMDHVSRLRRPARSPDVFTWDEITAIRAAIRNWEKRPILAGPHPDGQLGQIVEVMLGRPPASAKSSRSASPTSTSTRPCRWSVSRGRLSVARASPRIDRIIRRPHARSVASRCPGSRCVRSVLGSAACVSSARGRCCSPPAWGHRTRRTTSVVSSVMSWTRPASRTSLRIGSAALPRPRSTTSGDSSLPPSSSVIAIQRSLVSTTSVGTRP